MKDLQSLKKQTFYLILFKVKYILNFYVKIRIYSVTSIKVTITFSLCNLNFKKYKYFREKLKITNAKNNMIMSVCSVNTNEFLI